MSARFRPESSPAPRRLRLRSDPPQGVRASTWYADQLLALPRDAAVVISRNVIQWVRADLGDDARLAEWLVDVLRRRGAPLMVNLGDRTHVLGLGTAEHLLGHVGVHHQALESEFGRIERVYRPEEAA